MQKQNIPCSPGLLQHMKVTSYIKKLKEHVFIPEKYKKKEKFDELLLNNFCKD